MTYLEKNFPDVPEDLEEIEGEIYIYRDFTGRDRGDMITPCNREATKCIYWGTYPEPRPCSQCINLNYSDGCRKLFHDTGVSY
ncbi:hypothetical protein FA11_0935 [Pelosinus fermentans A11]|uniref:Uncharacterized protein n=1 Tax=Pelosinus fermentans B4 TaxID=1149862 RepID=I8RMB1_9FIRM|nr:hypothetical protein FB4_0186 [Pelosinus fermentans B4]EIW21208.1 hypothetical protein FA11_0935 [Pelosinus fermentans A11]